MVALSGGLEGAGHLAEKAGVDTSALVTDTLEVVTEYDHRISKIGDAAKWITDAPAVVPDVLLVGDAGAPFIVGIEAKMFHRPSSAAVNNQLHLQMGVLDAIAADALPGAAIHQLFLAPEPFVDAIKESIEVPTLTWEELVEMYPEAPEYWRDTLRTAVAAYGQLKSATVKINHGRIHGSKLGEADPYTWVGLKGGRAAAERLAAEGTWEDRDYEFRRTEPPTANPNWLPISEFLQIVADHTAGQSDDADSPGQVR